MLRVAFPTNVATSGQIQMSFNGGIFTITASYLSSSSYIVVNGFKGKITSHSNTQVTYEVPPQVNAQTQTAFGLA